MSVYLGDGKPKDHMLIHLSDRIRFMGSPSLYANWLDEGYNRLLRDVAFAAHHTVFDRRVLLEFAQAFRAQEKEQRTKRQRLTENQNRNKQD